MYKNKFYLSLSLSLFLKIALNIKTLKCAATFPRKTFSSVTPLTFMKVHTNRQKYSKLGKIYRYDIVTDYICVYSLLSKTGSLTRLFANHLELFLHLRAIKMIYSLTSWLRSSVRIAITSKSINLMKRSLSEPYSRMFWSGIYFSKDIVLVSWFNTAFS